MPRIWPALDTPGRTNYSQMILTSVSSSLVSLRLWQQPDSAYELWNSPGGLTLLPIKACVKSILTSEKWQRMVPAVWVLGSFSERLSDLSVWECETTRPVYYGQACSAVWLSSPNEEVIKHSAPAGPSSKLIMSYLWLAWFVVRVEWVFTKPCQSV